MTKNPTVTTGRNRLFAIRLSSEWVELRSCKTPIKGIQTTVLKPIVETYWKRVPIPDAVYPFNVTLKQAERTKKIKLTCIEWRGGRKLGLFKATKMIGRLGCLPTIGMATEVKPDYAKFGLDPKWRKRMLVS